MLTLLLALLAASPANTPWAQSRVLAEHLASHPCAPAGKGQQGRMSEATLLCAVFAGGALVSQGLEDPARQAEAVALLEPLMVQALSPAARQPFLDTGLVQVGTDRLPGSVLYRGGLLLLLTGRARLAPDAARQGLMDSLALSLAEDLERQPYLPTFGKEGIWPCDHAPAASGLLLHGELRGAARSRQAGQALVARLGALAAWPRGFPTRVDAKGKAVEPTPRGTAQAWTAGFLLQAEPAAAARLGKGFVAAFCERPLPGLAACREWPAGMPQKQDDASGPILNGYGTGATALGLAAARALPGSGWEEGLLATARLGGIDTLLASPAKAPLEGAIHLWALTARSWLPSQAGAAKSD